MISNAIFAVVKNHRSVFYNPYLQVCLPQSLTYELRAFLSVIVCTTALRRQLNRHVAFSPTILSYAKCYCLLLTYDKRSIIVVATRHLFCSI